MENIIINVVKSDHWIMVIWSFPHFVQFLLIPVKSVSIPLNVYLNCEINYVCMHLVSIVDNENKFLFVTL